MGFPGNEKGEKGGKFYEVGKQTLSHSFGVLTFPYQLLLPEVRLEKFHMEYKTRLGK